LNCSLEAYGVGPDYEGMRDLAHAQDLLHRALQGFDNLLGRQDSDTVECIHALGECFVLQERYFASQALFNMLLKEQFEAVGKNDQTLRSLSALANSYFTQERWQRQAASSGWQKAEDTLLIKPQRTKEIYNTPRS
jgi:hypothetical protein